MAPTSVTELPVDSKDTIGTPLSTTTSIDKDVLVDSSSTLSSDADELLPPLDEKPRFTNLLFRRSGTKDHDIDAIATRRSVFDDPVLGKHYFPTDKYENKHRFDASARWTFREERVRLCSRVLLQNAHPFSCRQLCASSTGESCFGRPSASQRYVPSVQQTATHSLRLKLNIDRGNLTQANTDNFLPDLNMTTNDYNLGNTVFRLAFLAAELPSQLVSKRVSALNVV